MKFMKNRTIGIVISYILLFLDIIIGIIYTPLLIKSFGEDQYGLYDLVASIANYIAIVDIGLGATVTRYIIKFKTQNDYENEKNSIKTCLIAYIVLSVLSLIITFALSILFPLYIGDKSIGVSIDDAQLLLIIMGINTSISLFMHAFSGVAMAYNYYSIEKILKIIRIVLRFLLVICIVRKTGQALSLALIDITLNLMMLFIFICFFSKEKISLLKGKFKFNILKEMLIFTVAILFQSLINQINTNSGKIIVGWRADSLSSVTTYSVIIQLYLMYCNMASVIQNIYYPSISRDVFNEDSTEMLTNKIVTPSRLQLFILLLIFTGFILFGEEFIQLWVGFDSKKIWFLTLLLMFFSIIHLSENTITCILKARNLFKQRTFILGIGAIVSLLASIIISFWFDSVTVVVFVTSFSLLIFNTLIMNLYYKKYNIVAIKSFFKQLLSKLLLPSILSLVLGLVIKYLIPSYGWVLLAIKIILYSIVFLVFLFLFGLNKDEKNNLKKFLKFNKK